MPRRNNMEFDTQKYPGAWKKILHYCRKYNILMIIAILAAIGGTIATLSGPDRLQERLTLYISEMSSSFSG